MKLALITKTLYLNNKNNNCNFPLHPFNLFWIMGWLFIERWYNLKKTNKLKKKKNKTKTWLTVREMHSVSLHFNPKYYCVLLTIRKVKETNMCPCENTKKYLSQPFWKRMILAVMHSLILFSELELRNPVSSWNLLARYFQTHRTKRCVLEPILFIIHSLSPFPPSARREVGAFLWLAGSPDFRP